MKAQFTKNSKTNPCYGTQYGISWEIITKNTIIEKTRIWNQDIVLISYDKIT